ncbi:MAG: ThiF family adenylyltransferase, partial [Nitrososphaera sp.]|nr:ThiF family adenylyltransferase [Nitrososphaera sp.]
CTHVRVVGREFRVTYNDRLVPMPKLKRELERTVSAWGVTTQATLARLKIGIVGAGSVGSIVGESIVRMGIADVILIDFDSMKMVNLDRTLHAISEDALQRRAKVIVLSQALQRSATADHAFIRAVEASVCEEEGFRAALDCDVLFSCVDRPWPRHVLNFMAYAHLIPVVDGGIRVRSTKRRTLRSADWKAHIASPDRKCLECRGQYSSGLVQAEREGYLDDPKYIEGLPEDDPIRRNENVFAFSLGCASLEVLQMLFMVIAPLDILDAGGQTYHFVPGILDEVDLSGCSENCAFPGLIASGDQSGFVVTGRHVAAEEARSRRMEK